MSTHTVDWHPAELIPTSPRRQESARFALIILNQPLSSHIRAVRHLWGNAAIRVAADGGANCLYRSAGLHGVTSFDNLDVIIGDLDSLTDDARAYYEKPPRSAKVILDPDQYSTDFGKAVTYVRKHHHQHNPSHGTAPTTGDEKALDIVAVGGLGGRVDQGLSQLHHLYIFQTDAHYAQGRMYLFSGESLTFLLKAGARHRIRVRDGPAGDDDIFGKHVGILPVGEPSRITTRGLEWDVTDWETKFGGQLSTSNHVLPETQVVEVETTRDVLFTIAVRQT